MQPFDQLQCLIVGMLLGTVCPITTTGLQDDDQAWFINQGQLPTGRMDMDILVEGQRLLSVLDMSCALTLQVLAPSMGQHSILVIGLMLLLMIISKTPTDFSDAKIANY